MIVVMAVTSSIVKDSSVKTEHSNANQVIVLLLTSVVMAIVIVETCLMKSDAHPSTQEVVIVLKLDSNVITISASLTLTCAMDPMIVEVNG